VLLPVELDVVICQ